MREIGERQEQLLGVGVLRLAVQGRRVVLLGNDAAVHDDNAVADLRDDTEVVGDEDDPHPEVAGDPADELEDLGLNHDIEGGRRLVRHDDVRVAGQGQRDHRSLAHAARVGVRVLARTPGRDADTLEKLPRALIGLGL